ncbi:sugar-transfer associated ATP-grasp domain-containing protein [Gracilibacillus timonensis]|uniref:sugar-transfer associated ATP-grasp domain-containing protein n=1 Tax=Gracilibacillus timonensis TaxID=1816696 RepID=UPI000824D2B2|nr:sugar-transfer associated ATP-grasp domain-containing protein [Gracilibacillus timonensis]
MANKILKFAKEFNKPFERFILVNGWNLRLYKKKKNGVKLKQLNRNQKHDIKDFWKKYGKRVNPNWTAYFSFGNDYFDPRYIPESLYYGEIAQKLYVQGMGGLHHKNVQEQLFDSKQPKTIVRKINNFISDREHNPISLDYAIQLCKEEKEVIIKPSTGTYGGKGIMFWKAGDQESILKDILTSFDQVIAQEVVESHQFMKNITTSTINTLRVVTLLVEGEPVLLSTLLRMGKEGSRLDGVSTGGVIAVVNTSGFLEESAVQLDQTIRKQHDSGFIFKDKKIPSYKKWVFTKIYGCQPRANMVISPVKCKNTRNPAIVKVPTTKIARCYRCIFTISINGFNYQK